MLGDHELSGQNVNVYTINIILYVNGKSNDHAQDNKVVDRRAREWCRVAVDEKKMTKKMKTTR